MSMRDWFRNQLTKFTSAVARAGNHNPAAGGGAVVGEDGRNRNLVNYGAAPQAAPPQPLSPEEQAAKAQRQLSRQKHLWGFGVGFAVTALVMFPGMGAALSQYRDGYIYAAMQKVLLLACLGIPAGAVSGVFARKMPAILDSIIACFARDPTATMEEGTVLLRNTQGQVINARVQQGVGAKEIGWSCSDIFCCLCKPKIPTGGPVQGRNQDALAAAAHERVGGNAAQQTWWNFFNLRRRANRLYDWWYHPAPQDPDAAQQRYER